MIPNESMTSDIVNCFSFIVPPPPQNIKVKSYAGEKDCKCLSAVERRASPFPLLLAASWELVYSDKGT